MHPGQPHEPGWLGGELNGKVGWFPEAYVELADAATSDAAAATLQPIGKMLLHLKLMKKIPIANIMEYRKFTSLIF